MNPDRITRAHDELDDLAGAVSEQVKRLRSVTEGLLREHRSGIAERQFHQKRLASAVSDIYAQVAVLSRVTAHLEEHGVSVELGPVEPVGCACTSVIRLVSTT